MQAFSLQLRLILPALPVNNNRCSSAPREDCYVQGMIDEANEFAARPVELGNLVLFADGRGGDACLGTEPAARC